MVQIDIVLKIGDCEKQMPMDEARNLYYELSRLFNGGGDIPRVETRVTDLPDESAYQEKTVSSNEHPSVTAAREAARKRTSGCSGCGGSKTKANTTATRGRKPTAKKTEKDT